ncbi:glycoside hydrolase [Aureobasidium pullulans]|uniref:Glycoside hydrolase n=1 Tax=Aureobasidium pullulans TaxID=5580 RepID=A0A4S9KNY2_AURPU|nr:glycoside hydrolase [Aureobasidium pullulans]
MLLLSVLVALMSACHVQAKAVFAHYIVGNVATLTPSYSTADWQKDIRSAQSSHIDAFALNIANDGRYGAQLANAFSAANTLGFKLFFSFDYAAQGAFSQQVVIDLINQYKGNGAYYQYNGKAFVSTFEGPGNSGDWTTIKSQTGCFFIPDWSSLGAQGAINRGVADGLFSWEAWPVGPNDMTTQPDVSYKNALAGKPYMMPVSPWFYTNLPGYSKNWLWRGDDMWYDRWQQVMSIQPDFVEILTWNDWGESHYIADLDTRQFGLFGADAGKAPFNYASNMPHDGWRLFLPYVIDMYKNGKASISTEGLVSWYRLTPGSACSSGGTTGNTASQGQQEYPPAQLAQDKVFYSALLTSTADVTVTIGGTTQTGTWENVPSGGSGIYHGSVPFSGRGAVTVKITRNGNTVAQMNGLSITDTCANGIENWNAWVGSATAGSSGSGGSGVSTSASSKVSSTLKTSTTAPTSAPASTPTSSSGSYCIAGTGNGNLAGLCSFSCNYGFCPTNACTCTQRGRQVTPPATSNTLGFPVAGQDVALYSGLCEFTCSHGYCPSGACTSDPSKAQNGDGSFCTAGTGSGNLAGLCSFSCNYGFCPSNACTCTQKGGQINPPAASNTLGFPVAGQNVAQYSGLCEFACSHGYCPSGACTSDPSKA